MHEDPPWTILSCVRDAVLVVSGLPRSGTSLAMALLAEGGVELLTDGVRGPDPDNPLGYHEYEGVKRLPHDARWLAAARGRAVKVIHAFLQQLPEGWTYRVILLRRNLRDVVASQDRMLARRGQPVGGLPAERVAEVLGQQLDSARDWLRSRPDVAWMELDYDALLREPEPELARLIEFAALRVPVSRLAALIQPERRRDPVEKDEGPAARAAGPVQTENL